MGIAVDTIGNIFIADSNDNVIRMMSRSAGGIISTVAGTGKVGYTGDGGSALSANLYAYIGIAVDYSGNIYISDSNHHVIRMVTKSTGFITTVAGNGHSGYSGDSGQATLASLNIPNGVAVDSWANIYIADSSNNVIRMVTKSTGVITTIAGRAFTLGYTGDGGLATAALLNIVMDIVTDSLGNIYLVDSNNYAIRMISEGDGIITTVAGTGTSGTSGDGGLAVAAKLYKPFGVAVDLDGNIFITDLYQSVIRMVEKSTGIIQTVAGTGVAGYSGDGGPAALAQLAYPSGIAVDSYGFIIFSDTGNSRVRAFTVYTGSDTSSASSISTYYTSLGYPLWCMSVTLLIAMWQL